jgi:hypothetical protein
VVCVERFELLASIIHEDYQAGCMELSSVVGYKMVDGFG